MVLSKVKKTWYYYPKNMVPPQVKYLPSVIEVAPPNKLLILLALFALLKLLPPWHTCLHSGCVKKLIFNMSEKYV